MRFGNIDLIHGSRLKNYSNSSVGKEDIMLHILSSETGMLVGRLMNMVKVDDALKAEIWRKGLSSQNDTLKPLQNVFRDVPSMIDRLLKRKNSPTDLAQQAWDPVDL